jgi:DNA polymerase delta subunit 1
MRENRNAKVQQYVRRIELVQKRSIMYYQQQTSHPFLKIVVALPAMVPNCRGKKKKQIINTWAACTRKFHVIFV